MNTKITIIENGPAIIESTEDIYVQGDSMGKTKIALCRCGLSETKIYCDGSHKNKVKKKEEE